MNNYDNDQELQNIIEQIKQGIQINRPEYIYPYKDMGIRLTPTSTGRASNGSREEITNSFMIFVILLDNNKISEECRVLKEYIKSRLEL